MTSNVDTVTHVYDRFARGDAPAILATFAPNVEFRLAEGHPYRPNGEAWVGSEAVLRGFFLRARGEWDGWTIAVGGIVAAGDAVVVECRYTGTYVPTGRSLDVQVCHVWRFRDGKVASFHQYLDTAKLQETMGHHTEHALGDGVHRNAAAKPG